ncbi:Nucleus protein [Mycena venus]|uniref:Nucleus protein n=1 Tax=Mycena venus TaxID=2733690 RepID=A0A8H6XCF7_9AGAR|nr:Nucleus protein [Mycena venus]
MLTSTLVFTALLSFANAATTQLDIEAIEPSSCPRCSPTFTPGAVLSLSFAGSDVTTGQAMAQKDVSSKPVVTVSAFNATLTGNFTIAMVDADVVGTDYGTDGVNRHWLENGVTISSGTVSDTSATAITAYAGPGPAPGSGPHRYVVLLYAQPSTFSPPADLSAPVTGVHKFDLNAYVKDSGLGDIIAANYFTVEVGTDSTSLPVTSAVVTSTLASAAPSGGASGGPSGTGSASAPGSSSSNKPSGALKSGVQSAAAVLAAGVMIALL